MNKAFKTKLKTITLIYISTPQKAVTTVPSSTNKPSYKCNDCEDAHWRCYCLAS